MLVCIYTAISERQQFQPRRYPALDRLKSLSRNLANRLKTHLTGNLELDVHSYKISHALGDNSNRGDIAIRMAVRSQLVSAFAPRGVSFIEVEWGLLTDEVIEYINREVDLFVIAGGGYIFIDGDGSAAGMMLVDGSTLNRLKCPVIAYGIGLNAVLNEVPCSLTQLPWETRHRLNAFSKVCQDLGVRDQDTADLFALYGDKRASVVGDPVLCLGADDMPIAARTGRLKIGINLAAHGWRTYSVLKPMLPHILELLRRVQSDDAVDLVYLLHHDFERPVVRYLQDLGLRLGIVDGSATQLLDAYKELDFVIGQMLHSCIFAARAGVPFLNLAYDRKNLAFCSLLGIPECALEPSQVTPELLRVKFETLLKNRVALSTEILRKRNLLRAESQAFLNKMAASVAEKGSFIVMTKG